MIDEILLDCLALVNCSQYLQKPYIISITYLVAPRDVHDSLAKWSTSWAICTLICIASWTWIYNQPCSLKLRNLSRILSPSGSCIANQQKSVSSATFTYLAALSSVKSWSVLSLSPVIRRYISGKPEARKDESAILMALGSMPHILSASWSCIESQPSPSQKVVSSTHLERPANVR